MALPEPDAGVVVRVSALAAASSRPTLTEVEVVAVIKSHPMVDRDGITSDSPDWTQTWNLNAILSELWGMKAGKVAGDFTFSADGASYNKGEVLANCLEMEAMYGSRLMGSAATGAHLTLDPLHGVVVNG